MKKNGFTLVELLAMLVVLGIIMVIAIPNISGMLANQRLDQLKNDANSMVESAKMKVNKDRLMVKPSEGECIGLSLNYLDDTDSIAKGPNGGNYDKFDSIVIYTRQNNRYKYYVRLVEEHNGKRTGIHFVESTGIQKLKTSDTGDIQDNIGIVKTDRSQQGAQKIRVFGTIMAYCTTVSRYYSGGDYCVQSNGIYYDNDGNIVTAEEYNEKCN